MRRGEDERIQRERGEREENKAKKEGKPRKRRSIS